MAEKVKLRRSPANIAPKVTVASVALLVVAVAQAVLSGGWNAPETATAISALVTAVVGYFTPDTVEAGTPVETTEGYYLGTVPEV
jgi:hypothetical protein